MIRTTGITAHRAFTGEGGWLDDYCTMAARTRFPMSYHLLCGLMTLTSTIGRRCRLELPDCTLFPPISIMLLGVSGAGKSQSLRIARRTLEIVQAVGDFPFFHSHERKWSASGLMNRWRKWQQEGQEGHNAPLEGAYTCNEFGNIVKNSTGMEDASGFLIDALEHEELKDTTAARGTRLVKEVTIAFGFCSTVSDIRENLSANVFAGGLMHRFLIAFEWRRPDTEAGRIEPQEIRELGMRLLELREESPGEMEIPHATWEYVKALKNLSEERTFSVANLAGFWNRFPGYAAKLGAARAIAQGRWSLTIDDVKAGADLTENFLYTPLAELVHEIAAPTNMRIMYSLADDLYASGKEGIEDSEMRQRLGGSIRSQNDFLSAMKTCKLAWQAGGRWYRLQSLLPEGTNPLRLIEGTRDEVEDMES